LERVVPKPWAPADDFPEGTGTDRDPGSGGSRVDP
jgi:hypothetical protein